MIILDLLDFLRTNSDKFDSGFFLYRMDILDLSTAKALTDSVDNIDDDDDDNFEGNENDNSNKEKNKTLKAKSKTLEDKKPKTPEERIELLNWGLGEMVYNNWQTLLQIDLTNETSFIPYYVCS